MEDRMFSSAHLNRVMVLEHLKYIRKMMKVDRWLGELIAELRRRKRMRNSIDVYLNRSK